MGNIVQRKQLRLHAHGNFLTSSQQVHDSGKVLMIFANHPFGNVVRVGVEQVLCVRESLHEKSILQISHEESWRRRHLNKRNRVRAVHQFFFPGRSSRRLRISVNDNA